MAVMDYRTRDGLADYSFSIEFQPDIDRGWRVYITFQPYHHVHGDSAQAPYQAIDGNGRSYVNWLWKLHSLEQAKEVAAVWAELAQRYERRAREEHARHVEATERYQHPQKREATPAYLNRRDGPGLEGRSRSQPTIVPQDGKSQAKEAGAALAVAAGKGALEPPLPVPQVNNSFDLIQGDIKAAFTAAIVAACSEPTFDQWLYKFRSKRTRLTAFILGCSLAIVMVSTFGLSAMVGLGYLSALVGPGLAYWLGHRLWTWRHRVQGVSVLNDTLSLVFFYFPFGVTVVSAVMTLIPEYRHMELYLALFIGPSLTLFSMILFTPLYYITAEPRQRHEPELASPPATAAR